LARDAEDGQRGAAAVAPAVLDDQRKILKHGSPILVDIRHWFLYEMTPVDVQKLDEVFMRQALALAREAEQAGEVPVGAVLVIAGQVLGRGRNSPVGQNDPTAHAEILALREAARAVGNYRLAGATLYVTLEPCAMCAGALLNARVDRLVFGARDLRFGAVRSKFRLADSDLLNHKVQVVEGVLGAECSELIKAFFEARR
jgi:tRNA(adenine34) deaminase